MTWTDRFCEHLVMVTGRCSAAAGEVAMSIADRDNYNLKLGSVLPGRSTDAAVLIATHDPEVAAEADGHAVLDEAGSAGTARCTERPRIRSVISGCISALRGYAECVRSGRGSVQLIGSPGKLAFPAVCARCGAPAGRRIRVEKVFARSYGDLRTAYAVLRADVPFCLSCMSKHRSEETGQPFGERVASLFRSVLLVPALGFAVAALWSLLQAMDRLGGGDSALLFAGLFAGFALLALVCTRAALRRTHRYRVAEPSSVTSAFDFTDDLSEMFERERHDYRLANPVFGDAFVAVNASRVWHSDSGRARAADRGRSAVLLLSLTGGVAVLGWLGLSALRG